MASGPSACKRRLQLSSPKGKHGSRCPPFVAVCMFAADVAPPPLPYKKMRTQRARMPCTLCAGDVPLAGSEARWRAERRRSTRQRQRRRWIQSCSPRTAAAAACVHGLEQLQGPGSPGACSWTSGCCPCCARRFASCSCRPQRSALPPLLPHAHAPVRWRRVVMVVQRKRSGSGGPHCCSAALLCAALLGVRGRWCREQARRRRVLQAG